MNAIRSKKTPPWGGQKEYTETFHCSTSRKGPVSGHDLPFTTSSLDTSHLSHPGFLSSLTGLSSQSPFVWNLYWSLNVQSFLVWFSLIRDNIKIRVYVKKDEKPNLIICNKC